MTGRVIMFGMPSGCKIIAKLISVEGNRFDVEHPAIYAVTPKDGSFTCEMAPYMAWDIEKIAAPVFSLNPECSAIAPSWLVDGYKKLLESIKNELTSDVQSEQGQEEKGNQEAQSGNTDVADSKDDVSWGQGVPT